MWRSTVRNFLLEDGKSLPRERSVDGGGILQLTINEQASTYSAPAPDPPIALPRRFHTHYVVLINGPCLFPMALPSSPSPTILSCGDSPLSTTASVVGILTFALGLFASYIALQSATRGAPSEIARLVDDLRTTQREINRVAEYIFDDAHNATLELTTRLVGDPSPQYIINGHGSAGAEAVTRVDTMQGLYDEVQVLLGNCVRLFYEADDLLKKSESDDARWDPEGLRRRIVFVMNRHEVAEKMQRLEDQKTRLADVRMGLFLRKSAMQDAMLKQIAESLKQMQSQDRGRDVSLNDSGIHAP